MNISKTAVCCIAIIIVLFWLYSRLPLGAEMFRNILPTSDIDQQFISTTDGRAYFDEASGQSYQTINGGGVDLNCNAVEQRALLSWIRWNDPSVLNHYVLRYDPSANIDNPNDTPRIFKALLKNLPSQHKYVPLLTKCLPGNIRV